MAVCPFLFVCRRFTRFISMRNRSVIARPPSRPSPELGAVLRRVMQQGTNGPSSERATAVLVAVFFLSGLFAAAPVGHALSDSALVANVSGQYEAALTVLVDVQVEAYQTLWRGVLALESVADPGRVVRSLPAAIADTFDSASQTIAQSITAPLAAVLMSADDAARWLKQTGETAALRLAQP